MGGFAFGFLAALGFVVGLLTISLAASAATGGQAAGLLTSAWVHWRGRLAWLGLAVGVSLTAALAIASIQNSNCRKEARAHNDAFVQRLAQLRAEAEECRAKYALPKSTAGEPEFMGTVGLAVAEQLWREQQRGKPRADPCREKSEYAMEFFRMNRDGPLCELEPRWWYSVLGPVPRL